MNKNTSLRVDSLDKITFKTFKSAVDAIKSAEITSKAPLGFSSDNYVIHNNGHRNCEVSVRNHSGMLSMLITSAGGSFLFSGGWNLRLSKEYLANESYRTFIKLKNQIK